MKIRFMLQVAVLFLMLSSCNTTPSFHLFYTGFHSLRIDLSNSSDEYIVRRIMLDSLRQRYGLQKTDSIVELQWPAGQVEFEDTVPVNFGETRYRYFISNKDGDVLDTFETSTFHFPENLRPTLTIADKPGWEAIYQKAWDIAWHRTITSKVLPDRFAYNEYPDNDFTYVWDASFCNLFQRYAEVQGGHPGIKTFDAFYKASEKYDSGYIPRRVNINSLLPPEIERTAGERGTNPPLYGWAEWNHFKLTNDSSRLADVLPMLIKNFNFIETEMQPKPGYYIWDGNGSGWDNIDWGKEGEKLKYWVELPALQAFAAKYIVRIAKLLGDDQIVSEFSTQYNQKKQQMEKYWNEQEGWYCGLTQNGQFTRKTLEGMWPVMAGLADSAKLVRIVANLEDTTKFDTSPMPLPTLSKDEPGYNPKGEYWLGSVWINMSLMTIQSLRQNGYPKLARQLAIRTVNGIEQVYQKWEDKPRTLWECYSPEYVAPASHKTKYPDQLGTVRSDFGGWTGCLINLILEEVLGIEADGTKNTITCTIQFQDNYKVSNLKFGDTTTSLSFLREGNERLIVIQANRPYQLKIKHNKLETSVKIEAGEDNRIVLK